MLPLEDKNYQSLMYKMLNAILGFSLSLSQFKLLTLTVTDDEGLLHVDQEIEAKFTAPFAPKRFDFYFCIFPCAGLLV